MGGIMVNGGRSVLLDIPSILMLNEPAIPADGFGEYVRGFGQPWNVEISGVVYPMLWNGGSSLASDRLFSADRELRGWQLEQVAEACQIHGLDLWVDIDLGLPPLHSDLVHVRQFYGSGAYQACINSDATHRALDRLLVELAEASLAVPISGLVFSMQDLWPMSGDGSVDPSCFCRHCTASIRASFPEFSQIFNTAPTPWSVALRDTGTGIDHIQIFTSKTTPEELLGISEGKNFLQAPVWQALSFERKRDAADAILRYAKVRHDLTISALSRLLDMVKGHLGGEVKTAGIASGYQYDWTAGLFIDLLSSENPFDELWMEASNEFDHPAGVPFRYYMMSRARYYLKGFIESLEVVGGPSALARNAGFLRKEVSRRLRSANAQLASAPLALELSDWVSAKASRGAVIPAFSREIGDQLVGTTLPLMVEEEPEVDMSTFMNLLRGAQQLEE
jgi:hypothetical protein